MEVVTKFVPLIVRVCDADPTGSEVGENDEIVGTGLVVTVSVCVGELVNAPVPDAVITGLPAVVSAQKKLAEFAEVAIVTLVMTVVQVLLL